MKEMSLQEVREFWTYLQNQAELKLWAFLDTPSGSFYKNEMRAEAETYRELANKLSENFGKSVTSTDDINQGLTAEQTAGFLGYLDDRNSELKATLEKTQRNKQEALAAVQDMEYSRVKSIYKEMENLNRCQISVFENSHKTFISLLQEK